MKDYRLVFGLILVAVVLGFGFQGARGIWQPDEGYYVGTAVTMMDRGTLLVPYLGEEIFLDKPPMTYWGIIGGINVFGSNEFGTRAFNALCYVGTVLAVFWLGVSIFGRFYEGIAAAFLYATMAVPFIAANYITPDTPLVLWTTLLAVFFWKSVTAQGRKAGVWKVLMSCALGLGFLAKGPAVLIPCVGFFVFLILRRQFKSYFFSLSMLAGIFCFCIVGLSWYVYMGFKIPGAAQYFFDSQIWGRLVSAKFKRNPGLTGAFIYAPVLLAGTLPWSAILWTKLDELRDTVFKKLWWAELLKRPVALFLLCWFSVPMVLLCLASSRLGLYSLPLFPAIALVCSRFWLDGKTQHAYQFSGAKAWVKPAILCGLWVVVLMGLKFTLGTVYKSEKDARALWQSIKVHLPEGDYEIVTVDDRCDGLLFYGAKEVEEVTRKKYPYPTFSFRESVAAEIKGMADEKSSCIFLIKKERHLEPLLTMFRGAGVVFKEVKLPYDRWLVICQVKS